MTNEIIFEVMGEIEEKYVKEARRRGDGYIWVRWAVACLCTIAIVGATWAIFGRQYSTDGESKKEHTESIPVVSEAEIKIDMNTVHVNNFEAQAAAMLYYDPEIYDTVSWDKEDVMEYFGKDPAPEYIPEDLSASENNGKANVKFKKDGEIVYDTVKYRYTDEGSQQSGSAAPKRDFSVNVSKIGMVSDCIYITPEDDIEKTEIGDTDVILGYRAISYGPYDPETKEPSGYYDLFVAEFNVDGIEYQIVAEEMTLEEVVAVTASIIFGTDKIGFINK